MSPQKGRRRVTTDYNKKKLIDFFILLDLL